MKESIRNKQIQDSAVIALCFLLTSTGYLAWTYNTLGLSDAAVSDALTLVAAYLFQAAGIVLFSLTARRRGDLLRQSMYIIPSLYMLFLIPAALSKELIQAAGFGMVLNLLCGWIAGYYLWRLSARENASGQAVTLGVGYSISILASWLLSLFCRGVLYYSDSILIICLVLTAVVIFVIYKTPAQDGSGYDASGYEGSLYGSTEIPLRLQLPEKVSFRRFFILAAALIILFSMVNICGFGFPSADLQDGVNLEFSRLFYAAGLLLAGYLNHRNRRYGAICALIALIVPFFVLAVKGEPVSATLFWALSYFTFGFYSIYRMVLFLDISREKKLLWLSCLGLMFGRIGDALGEIVCLILSGHFLMQVGVLALLFIVSALLFFYLYQFLYQPEAKAQRSEREVFNRFSAKYDLSAREREVLRYLLDEKSNSDIASELMISEGTVKYHIHNLLQKTSCRNRIALIAAYTAERDM